MNTPSSYIGITGITTKQEVNDLAAHFASEGLGSNAKRIGMLGFAFDNSYARNGTSRSPRYLDQLADAIPLLQEVRGRLLPMIHYTQTAAEPLAPQLEELRDTLPAELCSAVQLNDAYPAPDDVVQIKERYPELDFVLQLQPSLLQHGPQAVAARLQEYRNALRWAIIDPSLGEGKDMDVEPALRVHDAIRMVDQRIGIVFAGGFSPANVADRVQKLVSAVGLDISIDAEGKLRTPDDALDIRAAKSYISAGEEQFRNSEQPL